MTATPPHLFYRLGIEQGHNPDAVSAANKRRTRLLANGVAPVLSLNHLAQLTGASYGYLRHIVERVRDPYVDISRPKKSGGVRAISSPEPVLMDVQRWILHNILTALRMNPASYAYQTKRSIVQCAQQHIGARWLVKLDLHDFFGGIEERRVYGVFRELGYAPLISFEMARICTRARGFQVNRPEYLDPCPVTGPYATGPMGYLPQGAPTSGALANAIATPLDQRLASLASERCLQYTRYSDDLTFSASVDFNRSEVSNLVAHIRKLVEDANFELHNKKTRVVPPGARHVVLGLVLGPDRVQLRPEFKRRINVHIHGVDRFGLVAHANYRQFRSVLAFINHVDGCLAFAYGVDREYAERAREIWNSAIEQSGFPVDNAQR